MVPRVTPSTRMATPGTGAGTGLEQYETVPDIPGPPLVAHGVGVGVGVPIGVAVAVAVGVKVAVAVAVAVDVGVGLGVGVPPVDRLPDKGALRAPSDTA